MYATISAIKTANEKRGHHFFSPSSMRFFASRIASRDVIKGRYFITSEQFHGSDGYCGPRFFTIRRANDDGSITTIGEFNADCGKYAKYTEALKVARTLPASMLTCVWCDGATWNVNKVCNYCHNRDNA